MASDDLKFESKTVRAIRGTEARTITKWKQQGWEVVDQKPGKLQTEILLRKPRPKFPWARAAIIGGIVLVLIVFLIIMSILEGDAPSDEPATAPQTSVEPENENDSAAFEATPEEATGAAEASTTATEAAVITVENNSDFAAVVSAPAYCSDQIASFASKYSGQTLRFEGSIDKMASHGDYDTRYDILISAGDFSETTAVGPAFQFRDVNMNDLNLTGDVPDTIGVGDNLAVTATVDEYVPEQCLFLLDPQETSVR